MILYQKILQKTKLTKLTNLRVRQKNNEKLENKKFLNLQK